MTVIPAIDILDGKCVRLAQGNYNRVTVYADNAADVARRFESAGAVRLHLVDLDAARAPSGPGARGHRNNRSTIRKIREAVQCTIEVGGGVRSDEDVEELLQIGIDRIVVGTALARDRERVAKWVRSGGRRFIAGVDARDGLVRISGWEEGTGIRDEELAVVAKEIGMISIIYTNISNDGMLSGPDVESTSRIARAAGLPVVLSGGIGSEGDVVAAAAPDSGIVGAILGKALYEGRVDLESILQRFPQQRAAAGASAVDAEQTW